MHGGTVSTFRSYIQEYYGLFVGNFVTYRISWPIRRTFFPEKCDLNSICVLCAEGIISKLINTRTFIIHLYREIVKTTMKMILVAVTIFWVSMMNKLYYGC